MKNISKEQCKEFALKVKEKTGKFPRLHDWLVKEGFICSQKYLIKLFGSYQDFLEFCDQKIKRRTKKLTLDFIKQNCTITEKLCWEWNQSIDQNGYGRIGYNNKSESTHRVSWCLANNKEIPKDLVVRHRCDNRKCCNPVHLELGTYSENSLDTSIRIRYLSQNNSELSNKVKKLHSLEERIKFYLETSNVTSSGCVVPTILKPLSHGYYRIQFKGIEYMLHRIILSKKLNKEYKEKFIARHLCNNKNCINVEHLAIGTNRDNAIDARTHSTKTKLTIEQVRKIKQDMLSIDFSKYGAGIKFDKQWSSELNVSKSTITNIRYGITWKDIIL